MNKIILLRSQDIFSDSRVLRWEQWFQKNSISYLIVGWDRERKALHRENTIFYTKKVGFQQKIKGIIGRAFWNTFLLRYLVKHRNEYEYIHACDFDTVLPALCMKIFDKKVIFDIFDWFSDEVRTGRWIIDRTINFLEKYAVKKSDLVIICEKERLKQMGVIPSRYIVIPNMPELSAPSLDLKNDEENSRKDEIKIAYVGGLVKDRGLLELLDVVQSMPRIKLEIAGFGEESIVRKLKKVAKSHANIKYDGKVSYKKAIEIMINADLIYAMYYKTNPNHIYAAPNKFYESIFLRKPIITTKGTLVGNKVEFYHTGITIEEGKFVLEKLLQDLSKKRVDNICRYMPSYNDFLFEKNRNEKKYRLFINY